MEFQTIAGQKTAGDGPITIGGPTNFPEDFWGFARNTFIPLVDWDGTTVLGRWFDALWRVPEFLSRSEFSYIELLELLGCYFINPANPASVSGRTLFIASRDPNDAGSCDLAKLEIQGVPQNTGAALATTIHRLVRLKRRIGWPINDLDRMLVALDAVSMDRDALVAVSIVERLRRRTGLEISELAGWFGDIDHATYFDFSSDDQPQLRSFYEEAFRIPDSIEPGSPFGEDAAAITGTITQHKVRLAARLGMSDLELDRLRSDERVLPAADRNSLTLSSLSALTRYASLAKWTGSSVDSLLAAADVFGFAPFLATSGTAAVDRAVTPLRFIEALDHLARVDMPVSTASYLFTDAGALDSSPGLAHTDIVGAIGSIIDTVRPVLSQIDYPADASGEIVASELSKIGWPERRAREAGNFFSGRVIHSTGLFKADAPLADLREQSRLVFDEAGEVLSVQGSLSPTDRAVLLQIAGTSARFKTAVRDLFDQPRNFAKARLRYVLPPEYSVSLSGIPGNLKLPTELDVALKFDADRRALVFRGDRELLSLVEYPAGTLNQEWTAFKAAVDTLSAATLPANVTQDPPAADNQFFATDAELESLIDGSKTAEQRCAYALERIAKGRWRLESERAALTALSGVTGLDATMLKACRPMWASLVIDATTNGPSALVRTQTAFSGGAASPVAAIVRRLHKLGVLFKSLGLPASANLWLLRNSDRIGGPNLQQLPARTNDPVVPWDQSVVLFQFARAQKGFLSPQGSLLDLMDVSTDPMASHADWWKLVALIRGWEGEQVRTITGTTAFPGGFGRPELYLRLIEKMNVSERCGVSPAAMMDWNTLIASSPGGLWTGSQLPKVAAEVKSGVRAKVGRARWLQISTEVNDPLRERRRDALLAYVLSRPNPWDGTTLRDADQLFDYLLVDTQMASCMLTSRIVQAIGSVQSFVQRALMGLEPGVTITPPRAREWGMFRKRYRVWEANRKVFLYPENWIEPELRDDKSSLFREVESRLLQSALSAGPASKAIADYADGVVALSDMEIIGAYRQNELIDGEGVNALHVVARSNSLPRQYFYRRANDARDIDEASWTPWSKVDLDIEGDYVLPFATGSDVYIFWMLVGPTLPKRSDIPDAPKKWEIKPAWSKLVGGEWAPKRLAQESLTFADDQALDASDAFVFSTQSLMDGVVISCSGIRTVTTLPTGPRPDNTISVGPPLANQYAGGSQHFVINVQVTEASGAPIADAEVYIWEISAAAAASYAASGIVPTNQPGPNIKSFTSRTGPGGVATSPYLQISWSKQWGVSVRTPNARNAEFGYGLVQVIINTPVARTDGKSQGIVARATFHRKPQPTTAKQLSSFGLFYVNWGGKVEAEEWPWGSYQTKAPAANITWSQNAYVETTGPEDRLFLPEHPTFALVPHTPGLFRLRGLSQSSIGVAPFYFLDSAGKRYHVSYKQVSGGAVPIFRSAFHPYARPYARLAVSGQEQRLLRRDQQQGSDLGTGFQQMFFRGGATTPLGADSLAVEEVSFEAANFFGTYNWELFFHLPFAIATQLTRNQRFADAQRWLHYVYDPTSIEANTFAPQYLLEVSTVLRRAAEHPGGPFRRPSRARCAAQGAAHGSLQSIRDCTATDHRVHEERGDEVPRQPDRVGRPVVRPRQHGIDQRGDTVISARASDPRTASGTSAEPRAAIGANLSLPVGASEQPVARALGDWRDRGGSVVVHAALGAFLTIGCEHRSVARHDDVLLHVRQREAAGLLQAGRRSALQASSLSGHQGTVPDSGVVRTPDRSGAARARAGRGSGHRRRSGRRRRPAAELPVQRSLAKDNRAGRRAESARPGTVVRHGET